MELDNVLLKTIKFTDVYTIYSVVCQELQPAIQTSLNVATFECIVCNKFQAVSFQSQHNDFVSCYGIFFFKSGEYF